MHGFVWFSSKKACVWCRPDTQCHGPSHWPNRTWAHNKNHPIPRDIPWYTLHDRARLEMVSGGLAWFTTFWQTIGARMGWPKIWKDYVWWPILAQKMVLGCLSLTKCLHTMILWDNWLCMVQLYWIVIGYCSGKLWGWKTISSWDFSYIGRTW